MKTIQSLIATAALVVASATAADAQSTKPGATAPASPATRTAEDDRAIRKVLAALDVAWNTHEMKALERLFHEDAEFINVVGMHWRGRPAIVAAHVAYHKTIFKDVLKPGGKIFVAFYRLSPALEYFLQRSGLLNNHVVRQRECLETYLLTPARMIGWLGERTRTGWLRAAALILRLTVSGTLREKATTLKMQRIVRGMENPQAFIQAAPESQPYRDEMEIRRLFDRLAIPIKEFRALPTCWIVRV